MIRPIDFHRELARRRSKVDDSFADYELTPKGNAKSFGGDKAPEGDLRARRLLAHRLSAGLQKEATVKTRVEFSRHRLSPCPAGLLGVTSPMRRMRDTAGAALLIDTGQIPVQFFETNQLAFERPRYHLSRGSYKDCDSCGADPAQRALAPGELAGYETWMSIEQTSSPPKPSSPRTHPHPSTTTPPVPPQPSPAHQNAPVHRRHLPSLLRTQPHTSRPVARSADCKVSQRSSMKPS